MMTDKSDDNNEADDMVDRYLSGDSQISRLYTASKQERLPQGIASKVLAEAENEMERQPTIGANPSRISWTIPLGLAAGVALTVGILLIKPGAENAPPFKNASSAIDPVVEPSGQEQYGDSTKQLSVAQLKSTNQLNRITDETPSQSASAEKIDQPQQEPVVTKMDSIARHDSNNTELLKDSNQDDPATIAQAGPQPKAVAELQTQPMVNPLLQNVSDNSIKSIGVTPIETSGVDRIEGGTYEQPNTLESPAIANELLQPLSDTQSNYSDVENSPIDLLQPLTNTSNAEQIQFARDQWLRKIVRLYNDNKTAEADAALKLFKQSYPDYPIQKYLKERLNN